MHRLQKLSFCFFSPSFTLFLVSCFQHQFCALIINNNNKKFSSYRTFIKLWCLLLYTNSWNILEISVLILLDWKVFCLFRPCQELRKLAGFVLSFSLGMDDDNILCLDHASSRFTAIKASPFCLYK